jgi:putative transcription factor
MDCEVCGRKILGKTQKALIDGAILTVCAECMSLGRRVPTLERQTREEKLPWEEGRELLENYPVIIRNAREKLGLTHEELARRIAERESVLKKLEAGKLRPDDKLINKLQRALKVRLVE